MTTRHTWLEQAKKFALLLLVAIGLNACAERFGIGGDSWKEEVLLHDGQKIIVERYTLRGGRHEIGQRGSYIAQSLNFTLPGTGQTIEWKDNRSEDLGNSNFSPMLLDIANGTPYLVVYPTGCLSYNKWGRPNPPYVVFKYVTNAWQRIVLGDLPLEIETPNLIFSSPDDKAKKTGQAVVSAETIKALNAAGHFIPEYKTILREPLADVERDCGEMIYDGNGGWIGKGWFTDKPSKAACLKYCDYQKITSTYCPCDSIFRGEN